MLKQTKLVRTDAKSVRPRTGKRPAPSVDLHELMANVLEDLEKYLPVEDSLALGAALFLHPRELRTVVDQLTREAESSLAEGGFVRYVALRQVSALLEKNVDWFPVGAKERRAAALRTFAHGERSCRRANRRITWFSRRTSRLPEPLRSVMAEARMIFQQTLGRLDEAVWGEILDRADFGPGSTYDHSVETGTLAEKLSSTYLHTTTREALPYFIEYGKRNPNWVSYLIWDGASFEVVEGDRVTTVLKKWDKDRTIGIQPSLPVFLQKGAGSVMVDILRDAGIDLTDQQPNQRCAREGSIGGKVVTVDLKNASGCMAYKVVEWFCPGDWFNVLDTLRCAKYRIGRKGAWVDYESFSSMGNGFTFPLESLLFYSVAKACVRIVGASAEYLGVFGDDLTIPWEAALLTVEALAFLGFRTNVDKTHLVGNFRESCGTDYAQGVDVRPIYLDSRPVGAMAIHDLHNRLLAGSVVALDKTCSYLRSLCPNSGSIPGDFGLALLEKSGWFPGKGIRIFQGFITDPPDPSGWCTSLQAPYWTFREFVVRHPELKDSERFHWYAEYLAFLKGAPGDRERNARTEIVYRREGFSFTWLSVDELRGDRWRRRTEDPRGPETYHPQGVAELSMRHQLREAARLYRAGDEWAVPVRGS